MLFSLVFYSNNLDPELVYEAGNYVWALVPSFYLYAFFQTTTNYLQSQGVIYPPVIFNLCGTIMQPVCNPYANIMQPLCNAYAAMQQRWCTHYATIT